MVFWPAHESQGSDVGSKFGTNDGKFGDCDSEVHIADLKNC